MAEKKIGFDLNQSTASSSASTRGIQPDDQCMSKNSLSSEFKCHAKNCHETYSENCDECQKCFCTWHLVEGNHVPCDRSKECLDNSPPIPGNSFSSPDGTISGYGRNSANSSQVNSKVTMIGFVRSKKCLFDCSFDRKNRARTPALTFIHNFF